MAPAQLVQHVRSRDGDVGCAPPMIFLPLLCPYFPLFSCPLFWSKVTHLEAVAGGGRGGAQPRAALRSRARSLVPFTGLEARGFVWIAGMVCLERR